MSDPKVLTAEQVAAIHKENQISAGAFIINVDPTFTLCESHEALRAEVQRLRALDHKSRKSGCWCDEHGHPCKGCEWKQENERLTQEMDAVRQANLMARDLYDQMAAFAREQQSRVQAAEFELRECAKQMRASAVEARRYQAALEHIKKHQEIALSNLHHLSATWNIAYRALAAVSKESLPTQPAQILPRIDYAQFRKKLSCCSKCGCSQDLPDGMQVCSCECHPYPGSAYRDYPATSKKSLAVQPDSTLQESFKVQDAATLEDFSKVQTVASTEPAAQFTQQPESKPELTQPEADAERLSAVLDGLEVGSEIRIDDSVIVKHESAWCVSWESADVHVEDGREAVDWALARATGRESLQVQPEQHR